jgi:hypothetical protein
MALSGSTNYSVTRDDIVKRALRIIGALAQGRSPPVSAYSEAAQALNDTMKEWMADGLHLWKYADLTFPPVANVIGYSIGEGQTINTPAPLKIVQAHRRLVYADGQILDVELEIVSKSDWQNIPNKLMTGFPVQMWYRTPPASASAAVGTVYLWPTPSAEFVSNGGTTGQIVLSYMEPFDDFDGSTNNPDVPPQFYNALCWALADQLAFEYGVPISDRAQITKKAQFHKAVAYSFDQEEGSLFLQPRPDWGHE